MTATSRRCSLLGPLVLIHVLALGAQSSPEAARPRPDSQPAPLVTAIELRRQNVFDSAEATSWVTRLANRLHAQTRASVVRNELLFHVGGPFDSGLVAESTRNLRRLGIFRSVAIDSASGDSGVIARVTTRDGWTTALDFSVQSSGSQAAWSTELLETNFLGTNSRVLVKYVHDLERSASQFEFTRPRLIARTIGTTLYYEHRSDGHQYTVGLSKPFTSLASTNGSDIVLQDFGGRIFRFVRGDPVASDTVQRRLTLARLHVATAWRADNRGYLRVGLTAQVRRDDTAPESAVDAIPHTVTGALGPSVEWRRARYLVTRSFEQLGQVEDVDLSTRVRLELLAAPHSLGYAHDGVGPSASIRLGAPVPGGFGFVEGRAGGIYSAAGLDSGTALVAATAVVKPAGDRQRLLLHAESSWSRGVAIGSEFDLGFGYGPRAYRSHAFTGDRSWFATAEYRYTLAPDFGKLAGVGLAAFVDRGGAWFAGSAERNGTDVGLGLRIGPTRQADLRTTRIDFARRFGDDVEPAGWVIVVGKGFTFRTAQ